MKTLTKGLFGATAATALAVATASPAEARPGDGIDGEDILTGVLIAGAAAAVIAAATDDDDRYDDDYYGRDYRDRYGDRYGSRYGRRGYRMNAREAVRRCAAAAERRASRYGRARVTRITDVDRERRGYEVEGRLIVDESRYGWNRGYRYNSRYDRRGRYYRDRRDIDRGRFSCEIRRGRITDIDIDGI